VRSGCTRYDFLQRCGRRRIAYGEKPGVSGSMGRFEEFRSERGPQAPFAPVIMTVPDAVAIVDIMASAGCRLIAERRQYSRVKGALV
jgi:hypothetical protein